MPCSFKTGWRLGVLTAALSPMLAGAVDLALTSSWDPIQIYPSYLGGASTLATAGFTVIDMNGDGRDDIIHGTAIPLAAFSRISFDPDLGGYFVDHSVPVPFPHRDQINPELRIVARLTPTGAPRAITWQGHSVAIYNLASGQLERLSDPSGFDWPVPIAAIDLNGDGDKEIIIRDQGNVRVMNSTLSRELGATAVPQAFLAFGPELVAANLDADAAIELAVENGEIYEFVGYQLRRQGAIEERVNDWTLRYAGSTDIDGDGNEELFVSYNDILRVYDIEAGAVRWTANASRALSRIWAARLVDIDRDGVKDLLTVTENNPPLLGFIIGYDGVDGHELVRIAHPDGYGFAVNAGDFDGDGATEIAAALVRPVSGPNRLYIYDAATGALEWRSEEQHGDTTAVTMHDIDLDGSPEVVAAVRGLRGRSVDIRLLAFDAQTFERKWATVHPILPAAVFGHVDSLAIGDVDGDGDNEIAIGMQAENTAVVVIVDGATRQFVRQIVLPTFETVGAIATFDFDGDGDQEIVAAASAPYPSEYGGETFILDGVSGQTVAHGGLGTYHSRRLSAVQVGDVTGDARADIVAAGTSAEGLGGTVFIMDGVTRVVRGEVLPETGHQGLALIDVDGDGVAEIVLGNSNGAIDVRRGSDLVSLRRLTPCTSQVWAIAANNLAGASPGDGYYACDDRLGSANLRAGGTARGITGMVAYRAGIGNVLLATGTAAAPRIVTSSFLGLRHLTPSTAVAPYVVPGNNQNGPAVFAGHWRQSFTGQITFGSYTGRAASVQLLEGPASGTFRMDPDGEFAFIAGPPRRVERFTVRVNDGAADSVPMTFAILVTNSRPSVPQSLEFTVTAGTTLSTAVNAQDADSDPMTFTVVIPPTKGVLQLTSSGAYTYSAFAGASGDDTFTYYASDASDRSASDATVIVHIQPAATPTPPVTPPANPPSSGGGGGGGFDVTTLILLALFAAYARVYCGRRRTRREG